MQRIIEKFPTLTVGWSWSGIMAFFTWVNQEVGFITLVSFIGITIPVAGISWLNFIRALRKKDTKEKNDRK